jgi:hypothetical protein
VSPALNGLVVNEPFAKGDLAVRTLVSYCFEHSSFGMNQGDCVVTDFDAKCFSWSYVFYLANLERH